MSTPDDKVYDVRISVNGVELDFAEFQKHLSERLESWVVDAAGEIVRNKLDPKFHDLHYRIETALSELADLAESERRRRER